MTILSVEILPMCLWEPVSCDHFECIENRNYPCVCGDLSLVTILSVEKLPMCFGGPVSYDHFECRETAHVFVGTCLL